MRTSESYSLFFLKNAIEKICGSGATLKLVFSTPQEADKMARHMSRDQSISRRLRKNAVVFWK